MNITTEIAKEMGEPFETFFKQTSEFQIYANHNNFIYQWRDNRFTEHSDVWENESFDTRMELKKFLTKHIKLT